MGLDVGVPAPGGLRERGLLSVGFVPAPCACPDLARTLGVPPLPGLLVGSWRVAWPPCLLEGGARKDPLLSVLRVRTPPGPGRAQAWRLVCGPGSRRPGAPHVCSLCSLVLEGPIFLAKGPAVVRKVPSSVDLPGQCGMASVQ